VDTEVTVETSRRASIGREGRQIGMQRRAPQVSAGVAQEHPVPVRRVAPSDQASRLGNGDVDRSADVGELSPELT
jgi:hypothetical protein